MTLATATASSRSGFASVVSVTHTTGTVSLVAGNVSNVTVSGSGGTTTDALGLATIVNRSNGSITNARGLYVIGLPTTGVTNNYGIYVAAISGASSVNYAIYTAGGQINFQGLPVSSAGLAAGTLWNNSGVINVA
jgi:hypothetical protein